jgi:hypothetical protein
MIHSMAGAIDTATGARAAADADRVLSLLRGRDDRARAAAVRRDHMRYTAIADAIGTAAGAAATRRRMRSAIAAARTDAIGVDAVTVPDKELRYA